MQGAFALRRGNLRLAGSNLASRRAHSSRAARVLSQGFKAQLQPNDILIIKHGEMGSLYQGSNGNWVYAGEVPLSKSDGSVIYLPADKMTVSKGLPIAKSADPSPSIKDPPVIKKKVSPPPQSEHRPSTPRTFFPSNNSSYNPRDFYPSDVSYD